MWQLLLITAACLVRPAAGARACDPHAVTSAFPGAVTFDHCLVLQEPGATAGPAIRVLWRVEAEEVLFGVHTDAVLGSIYGYFGLGFSFSGGMRGADMTLASVTNGGAFALQSYWSSDYTTPTPSGGAQQVLRPLGYATSPNGSYWAFRRPVAGWSGDDETSVPLLRAGGDHIIWAVGLPGPLDYHGGAGFRGSARVDLSLGASADVVLTGPDYHTLNVTTPTIRTDGTTSRYCWSWHRLPSSRKYHIVQVQAAVNNARPGLVHHIVSYACPASFERDSNGGDAGARLRRGEVVCRHDGSMPPVCPQNFIGWASSGVLSYPPEAGFPFGLGETTSILLELHYENLDGTVGMPDTSGFVFTYTPVLRQHDLGYLIVCDSLEQQAAVVQPRPQTLPAGHPLYQVSNLCPASCLRAMMPREQPALHVVSTTFHMHVKGVREFLELYKDGRRQGSLANTLHWDFEHQAAIPGDAVLHPGDQLLTRCVYNTFNRTSLARPYAFLPEASDHDIVGGFGTYDASGRHFEEMCVGPPCRPRDVCRRVLTPSPPPLSPSGAMPLCWCTRGRGAQPAWR